MKCLTRRVEVEGFTGRKVGIFCFFDMHLGSAACDERKLEADIAGVKARGDWWIDGGDAMECINRKDKRHNESMLAPWLIGKADIVGPQVRRYQELFADIRGQCLAKLSGNHEAALLAHSERDVMYEMLRFLKDGIGDDSIHINAGAQAFIRLMYMSRRHTDNNGHGKYRDYRTLLIFAGHGYGGGRMEGAGPLALGRLLKENNADLAVMGHRHHGGYIHQAQQTVNGNGNVTRRDRYAYLVPSYRSRLYNERPGEDVSLVDYADIQMFPAGTTGGVRIVFDLESGTLLDPLRNF